MTICNIRKTPLRITDLAIGHGGRLLVRDISFELSPGECVLLAGANGTGKTTLLRALASEGTGPGNGATLGNATQKIKGFRGPVPSKARTVLIPTNIPKVKGFTVEAFVRTGCYRESDWRGRISPEAVRKLDEALELLGIQALKARDISTLSDGEFRKACLAVGLTRQAGLLLLDEPTAFLDVENRLSVLETLREVTRKTGTTVLFSSHDLHDALPVVDRVFALTRDGRFLASGAENKESVLREAFPSLQL